MKCKTYVLLLAAQQYVIALTLLYAVRRNDVHTVNLRLVSRKGVRPKAMQQNVAPQSEQGTDKGLK